MVVVGLVLRIIMLRWWHYYWIGVFAWDIDDMRIIVFLSIICLVLSRCSSGVVSLISLLGWVHNGIGGGLVGLVGVNWVDHWINWIDYWINWIYHWVHRLIVSGGRDRNHSRLLTLRTRCSFSQNLSSKIIDFVCKVNGVFLVVEEDHECIQERCSEYISMI